MLCWLTSHLLTPTTRQTTGRQWKHEILKRDFQLPSNLASLPDTFNAMIIVDWHILMMTRMWPQTLSPAQSMRVSRVCLMIITLLSPLLCCQFSESTGSNISCGWSWYTNTQLSSPVPAVYQGKYWSDWLLQYGCHCHCWVRTTQLHWYCRLLWLNRLTDCLKQVLLKLPCQALHSLHLTIIVVVFHVPHFKSYDTSYFIDSVKIKYIYSWQWHSLVFYMYAYCDVKL